MIARALLSPRGPGFLAIASPILITLTVQRLVPGLLAITGIHITAGLLPFPHDWARADQPLARGFHS